MADQLPDDQISEFKEAFNLFKKDGTGRYPDRASSGSGPKRSSGSSNSQAHSSSSNRKEFLRSFIDSEILTAHLEDWLSGNAEEFGFSKPSFDVPFELSELQNFDYALESVSFRQLIRMPNALNSSTPDDIEATAHLAIEDFLHASVKGIWERFWGEDTPLPFSVACIHNSSSKFYPAEKAIACGKLKGLCATAIVLKFSNNFHGRWDQIIELALLRPDIGNLVMQQSGQQPSHVIIGEALFFALRVLISRSLSKSKTIFRTSNCVFVLLVDSQYGGVVKVEGDLNKFEFDVYNVYECAADWIKAHAKISVSPVDRVWNKLGNCNWGDVGTLRVLLATFHSIVQLFGMPKYSLDDLATEHGSRLHNRRTERQLVDSNINENGLFRYQQRSTSPEIVEVQEESVRIEPRDTLKVEKGSVIWLEDSNFQNGFQINDILTDGELQFYSASPVEEPGKSVLLYIGSSPSHLEPKWEDMNQWYQVQRQTKILTIMKQRGISSKYLPQIVASGRVIHPGQCNKPSSKGSCDHPWCGTPILVTSPYGETVADLIANDLFTPDEALKCCHDCLSALSIASFAGIKHGDIRPENLIRVTNGTKRGYYVLIGWGHAVIEDRDRPPMNLLFSSTYALQEGRLCAASDAESLIYVLYFACGGGIPALEYTEGALQWREVSWSKRIIQQKLGDVSAVLKAFADYVDSLCGTPYPIDYDIWLRRLKRVIKDDDHDHDHGKGIVVSN